MTYASKADIDELYGVDLLVRIADFNRDGVPDDDVVTKALLGADEIINAYLSAQYPVPVSPVPGVVRSCAIDIAVYRIALGRAQRSEEMRVRYEDALAILDRIAKGQIGLGQTPVDGNGDGVPDPVAANRKGRMITIGRA